MKSYRKDIGFEFEVVSNISPTKLKKLIRKATGWSGITTDTDCSIQYEDENMNYGIEIQTKPVPAGAALVGLRKIYKIFRDNDIKTNDSTGVHVNISFSKKGYNHDIDAHKLQVITDDIKWLKKFERIDCEYAISPKFAITELIEKMNKKKNASDESVMTRIGSMTSRYESDENEMNIKENSINITKLDSDSPYVEFRIIGGPNYQWKPKESVKAIEHFNRAMDMSLGNKYDYLYKRYVSKMNHQPKYTIIPH